MDKQSEHTELLKVFGAVAADKALAHERPDFLMQLPGEGVLGVEVTSVFSSNAAAKVAHMLDYSGALLDGSTRMHRADAGQFEVSELVLTQGDGTPIDTMRAIILQQPSPSDAWGNFWAQVQMKEEKASAYLDQCDFVDLVISDPGRMFFHRGPKEFQKSFLAAVPKRAVLASPFREIYLITSTLDGSDVVIPLRSNLFAGDCLAFEDILMDEVQQSWDETFLLLVACLHMEGYKNLQIKVEKEAWGLLSGAWEMHYSEDVRALRDWSVPPTRYPGTHVREWLDKMRPMCSKVQRVVERRKELSCAVHVARQAYAPGVTCRDN